MEENTHKPDSTHFGIDRNASAEDWFVRLRAPGCTEIERAAFRRWLQESTDNEAAYRRVKSVWDRSAALRDSPAIAAATREALAAGSRRPRRRRRIRPLTWSVATAAILVLAVALMALTPVGIGSLPPGFFAGGESFTTVTAEQRSFTLTDGSRILLDAESTLRVDYDDQSRRLYLQRGQAQFEVAHDANRPFVVKAGDSTVRALGTEFQVRVDNGTATVTLLEGKVSVDAPGLLGGVLAPARHEVLAPGQKLTVANRRTPLEPTPADLEVAIGWTRGDLVFKRWPLQDLVTEMNRHSDTRIHIGDPQLRALLVSGRFRAGDQQSLIQALEHQWPIRAQQVERQRIELTMQ